MVCYLVALLIFFRRTDRNFLVPFNVNAITSRAIITSSSIFSYLLVIFKVGYGVLFVARRV